MAQLSDRGQLLLVGAFVLAVTLVGLTVVLNASSQTTTVAGSGGASVNGGDAVAARQAAERNVGSLLWTWNRGGLNTAGDWEARFATNVSHLGNGTRTYGARRGQFTNVTVAMYDDVAERGTRVTGPVDGTTTFPPAPVRARNATFLVTGVPTGSTDELNFSVISGGDYWDMYVAKESAVSNDIVVGTDGRIGGNGRDAQECVFDASVLGGPPVPIRIDVADATVVTEYGTPQEQTRYCPALDRFGSGDSFDGYGLSVSAPLTFSGEYSLLVNESGVSAPPTGSAVPVIYNATVRFRYRSPTVVYETDIRVAPGEIP